WPGVGRGGQTCQSTPRGWTVAVSLWRWTWVWWRAHSRAPLARVVGPPSTQCLTWWLSHHWAGTVQPGKVHPWSLSQRALRMPGGKRRRGTPRSRTSPWVPRTTGTIPACQLADRVGGEDLAGHAHPGTVQVRHQVGQGQGDHDLGLLGARQLTRCGGAAADDLDEGVGASARRRAGVGGAVRGGLGG